MTVFRRGAAVVRVAWDMSLIEMSTLAYTLVARAKSSFSDSASAPGACEPRAPCSVKEKPPPPQGQAFCILVGAASAPPPPLSPLAQGRT